MVCTDDVFTPEGYLMIKDLLIDNYRSIRRFQLNDLRRINVVVGKNASGKTVLMEAIKLGLDAQPAIFPWLNGFRNMPTVLPPNPTSEQFQALFLDFFHNFDPQSTISIQIRDSADRTASLRICFDPKRAVTAQPALGFQSSPAMVPLTVVPLVFERTDFQRQKSALSATVNPAGQLHLEPGRPMGIVSGFISNAYFGIPNENATWLSQLSIAKRSGEVLAALQRHFPFIKQVSSEVGALPGFSTVYAELEDLPRKIPLSLISGGLNRIFTLILAVITYQRGVVFVDEIENGLFHDQFELIWETLADLAIANDTQLFISTHSQECLKAAVGVIAQSPQNFSLLRLRREQGQSVIQFFGGEQMEAALEKNGEIRD